jgi:hypothetical protein
VVVHILEKPFATHLRQEKESANERKKSATTKQISTSSSKARGGDE